MFLTNFIQKCLYEVGKKHNFENLKDFFKLVYQVLLGQDQGPRLGSFIKLFGIRETVDYIKKLIDLNTFKYFTNFKILKIIRDNNNIEIIDNNNKHSYFSKLIFATHGDQILSLLDNPTDKEINVFNKFKYSNNRAYLHTDSSLMPRSKLAWSSWNFLNKSIGKKFTLTYWMNLLQSLPTNKNYFVE